MAGDWFDQLPEIDFSQLGPGVDLTPIAASLGLTRDQLAEMRDQYQQQQLAQFRSSGGKVAEDDLTALQQMHGQAPIEQASSFSPAPYAPSPYGGSQGSGLSSILAQQPTPPSLAPFSFDASQLPNSSGFKFRLDEGIKALDSSAASRGKSFTPDTRNNIISWAQGLASDELNNEYGRQANTYGINANQANTGFTQGLSNLQAARGYDSDLWNRGRTTQNDQFDQTRALTGDQWQRGLDTWNVGRSDQNDLYNQNLGLSQLILNNRPRPS